MCMLASYYYEWHVDHFSDGLAQICITACVVIAFFHARFQINYY
jgi:hypothetical protein